MNKTIKLLGVIALAAVIVFSMAACSNDTTNASEISYASGNYTLSITAAAKAAYTPASGDTYSLKEGTKIISSGTVSISGTTYTFKPASKKPDFTADFLNGYLIVSSTITADNGKIVNLTAMKDEKQPVVEVNFKGSTYKYASGADSVVWTFHPSLNTFTGVTTSSAYGNFSITGEYTHMKKDNKIVTKVLTSGNTDQAPIGAIGEAAIISPNHLLIIFVNKVTGDVWPTDYYKQP
jgi:hypothetical protein